MKSEGKSGATGNNEGNADSYNSQESKTILSGMLLNHCLLYKGIQTVRSRDDIDLNGVAFIYHRFLDSAMERELVSTIDLTDFLSSDRSNDQAVQWFHVASTTVLPLIFKHYSIPMVLMTEFIDTALRCKTIQVGKDGIIMSFTTFCLQDKLICGKKVTIFARRNLIVTHEQRVQAQLNGQSPNEERESVTTRSSLLEVTPPIIASPLMERSRIDQFSDNKFKSIGAKLQKEVQKHITQIDDWNNGNLKGMVLTYLIDALLDEDVQLDVAARGADALVPLIIKSLYNMALPVVNFTASELLSLHDKIFVRQNKPSHLEGVKLADMIDTFQSTIQVLQLLTKRSVNGLRISEPLVFKRFPEAEYEWSCISSDFKFLKETLDLIEQELLRMDNMLKEIVAALNDRVNLMLSMIASFFLPLTFITGIFGMNFHDGGCIVQALNAKNGSNWFWISCAISLAVMWVIFLRQGFLEVLFTENKNKYTEVLASQSLPFKAERPIFRLARAMSTKDLSSEGANPNRESGIALAAVHF